MLLIIIESDLQTTSILSMRVTKVPVLFLRDSFESQVAERITPNLQLGSCAKGVAASLEKFLLRPRHRTSERDEDVLSEYWGILSIY